MRIPLLLLSVLLYVFPAYATSIIPPGDKFYPVNGIIAKRTPHSYDELYNRLKIAIKNNKMGHITTASATLGAKGAGITIPGNRIVGVFANVWARRMLKASIAAGIEAPIRFYLTENKDGTSTLSYKTPSHVFSPYFATADPDLKVMAGELDIIFQKIFEEARAE